MTRNFARQERRKNIGKVDLLCPLKVAASHVKVLRHRAELDVLRAQNMAKLAQGLFRADIGTSVPRAVITGKKQLEFLPGLPAMRVAEDPASLGALNVGADPGLEDKIHHAADPP